MSRMDPLARRPVMVLLGLAFWAGCQWGVPAGVHTGPSATSQRGHGPPPWAPGHGYGAKYHYRYYPSVRVYYDTGRRLYFYHSDGNWQVGASLPRSIKIAREDYVVVEMNTGHPYEYHGDVVRRYFPGLEQKASQQEKKRRRH